MDPTLFIPPHTQHGVVLVENQGKLLPIQDSAPLMCLAVVHQAQPQPFSRVHFWQDQAPANTLARSLARYAPVQARTLSAEDLAGVQLPLAQHSLLVVGLYLDAAHIPQVLPHLHILATSYRLVVVNMGYSALLEGLPCLLQAAQNTPEAERTAAQIIFGSIAAQEQLPVQLSRRWSPGYGQITSEIQRLRWDSPTSVGMNPKGLSAIDLHIQEAIQEQELPGCQLLIARKGCIVLEKAYGTLGFTNTTAVHLGTLYDLASLSKPLGILPLIMRLYDQGRLDIRQPLGYYLPELRGTGKAGLTIQDLLAHQSRLPYALDWDYEEIRQAQAASQATPSPSYPYAFGPQSYLSPAVSKLLWSKLLTAPLLGKESMPQYSCLGYIFLQYLVERLLVMPLDQALEQELYGPLGLERLGYTPREKFSLTEIAPTDVCPTGLRKGILQGYSYEPRSALWQGGVSGNAGLFGCAYPIAILLQMYLQAGRYAGKSHFKSGTVAHFTKPRSRANTHGLGWQRPGQILTNPPTPPSMYGHYGLTGSVMWTDPSKELIIIFLSNKIHRTTATHPCTPKRGDEDIRARLLPLLYCCLQD